MKNSQRWYLLGRTCRGFCDVDLHFVVVVVLHLSFFFIRIFFSTSSVDYCQVFRPILYFQPSPSQSDSRHFYFSTIPLSSYRECYGFEWAFFTHRRGFFLALLPDILVQPAFIKVSLGVGSYFLESCKALYWSLKHGPGPSVWFTVIHNLLYILSLYFCMSILQKFYLWWKLW